MKYIGTNHLAIGATISRIQSSFDGEFSNQQVLIEDGIGARIPCVIGDIKEAYEMLKSKLNKDVIGIEEICEKVFEVVWEYFGDYSKISERLSYYNDLDEIESDKDIGRVSNLRGKNSAMCVERAMLSQNLLKSLGIESYYKQSQIIKNGDIDTHAYNIISHNNKYYIFDSAIPTLKNGKVNPLVAEIPREAYEQIISSDPWVGCSIEVNHYNPLRDTDVNIVYDAGRKYKYTCEEEINKTK